MDEAEIRRMILGVRRILMMEGLNKGILPQNFDGYCLGVQYLNATIKYIYKMLKLEVNVGNVGPRI